MQHAELSVQVQLWIKTGWLGVIGLQKWYFPNRTKWDVGRSKKAKKGETSLMDVPLHGLPFLI